MASNGVSDIALVAQGSEVATAAGTADSTGTGSGATGRGATSTESKGAVLHTVAITLAGDMAAAAAAAAAANGESEEASATGGGVSAGTGAGTGSIVPLLLPGTTYEVFITTEALESGGVYGDVLGNEELAGAGGGSGDVSVESATATASILVTTHANAPVRSGQVRSFRYQVCTQDQPIVKNTSRP